MKVDSRLGEAQWRNDGRLGRAPLSLFLSVFVSLSFRRHTFHHVLHPRYLKIPVYSFYLFRLYPLFAYPISRSTAGAGRVDSHPWIKKKEREKRKRFHTLISYCSGFLISFDNSLCVRHGPIDYFTSRLSSLNLGLLDLSNRVDIVG